MTSKKTKSQRIVVYNPGNDKEWTEFFCYGQKDPNICEGCQTRFRCLTLRDEEMVIPVEELGHADWDTVDAESIAKFLIKKPIRIKRRDNKKVAQIEYTTKPPKVIEGETYEERVTEASEWRM